MHSYCTFSQIPFVFSSTITQVHAVLEGQLSKEWECTVTGKHAWDEKVQKEENKDLEWAVGGEDGSVSLPALCVKMLS